MRNFLKVAESIDVWPALHEIETRPHLWNRYRVRTFHEQSAHRSLDDIILRYNRFDEGDDFVDKVCSRIEVENYPPLAMLPMAHGLVQALMARVQGEHLGRVFISRIRPGIGIPLHSDRIAPAEEAFPSRIIPAVYYDRYHIVLQSQPGVEFRCGDEALYMAPGNAYWFNNQIEHSVANNSAEDRIHLVADIHLPNYDYQPSPYREQGT